MSEAKKRPIPEQEYDDIPLPPEPPHMQRQSTVPPLEPSIRLVPKPPNLEEFVKGLSPEQTDKLAEVLAVSKKIEVQSRAHVQEPPERLKTASEIRQNLPEPPKNIIFKIMRGNIERKIEKQGEVADRHKDKIAEYREQSGQVQGKINKLNAEIVRYEKSNEHLRGLKFGLIRNFVIKSNSKKITKFKKQSSVLGRQKTDFHEKVGDVQKQLREQEANLHKLTDKIKKIDEVQNYPKAVLVYFLSEVHGAKAPTEEITVADSREPHETAEISQTDEKSAISSTFSESSLEKSATNSTFSEPEIVLDNIDIDETIGESDQNDRDAPEHDDCDDIELE